MADPALESALRQSLGATYRLVRELEPGAMSRVFLAHEIALDRPVVLKVLPESLATTISAERFRREIQLLAKLQHPQIVPLLASGDADGVLWYAMPYVEGESLRARLTRGGALPLQEAVAALRDVARALAYAHGKGIVHRDIKPENLLRVGESVQVADFGIARALSAAAADSGAAQTTAGMVLGTPRYMSPEQVVADPGVDHRADLYALGAVAFELLSGRLPYDGPTAVQMMRQHATAPIPSLRGTHGVPDALAALVSHLLAKAPDDRPQTAAAVLQQLEVAADGRHAGPRPRTRALQLGALGVALALGAALAWRAGVGGPASLIAGGKLKGQASVLMADFVNRTPDSTLAVTLQTALRVDLGQLSSVRMASVDRVARTLRRMTKPADTPLTNSVAREVAEREGLAAVVEGEVSTLGRGYVIVARIVTPAGEELAVERETASSDAELIEATGRLGRTLRRRLGESAASVRESPVLALATTASLPALRAYSRAVALTREARHTEALAAANEAIAADSGFAMAWNARGTAFFNLQQRGAEYRQSATRAYRLREKLTEPERLQVEASYASRVLGDPARSLPLLLRLGELTPDRSSPFNNASLNLMSLGRPRDAIVQLQRAISIDSTGTAARVNLVEAYYAAGDDRMADAALEDLARRFPGRDLHDRSKLDLLLDRGQLESGIALAEQRRKAARGPDELVGILWPLAAAEATRGHLRQADRYLQQLTDMRDADARSDRDDAARVRAIMRARAAAHWSRDSARARSILDSLRRSPAMRVGEPPDWPLVEVAVEYAELGYPREARALYEEQAAAVRRSFGSEDSLARARDDWRGSVDVAITLAEGKPDEAMQLILRYRATRRPTAMLLEQGLAHEALGQPDSALAAFASYESRRQAGRHFDDPYDLQLVRWRAGELAERSGKRALAAEWYGKFAERWRTADPELQPRVKEARRRIAELLAEPRF